MPFTLMKPLQGMGMRDVLLPPLHHFLAFSACVQAHAIRHGKVANSAIVHNASSRSANAASKVALLLTDDVRHIVAPPRIYPRSMSFLGPRSSSRGLWRPHGSRGTFNNGSCANCWMSDAW